jgi:ABC-type Fe3+-hydroxamate transport system substrate-binding protein
MLVFVDQLKRKVELKNLPQRIISVVPSQTELLYDLGLNEEVIGISKFCLHPGNWFRTKQRVGGTKTLNIEKIKSLQPDLIIANKEENVQEQIDELSNYFPVWISDVNTLNDAYEMIAEVGKIVGKNKEAQVVSTKIKSTFSQLQTPNIKPQTAYLIWKEPYMTVGGDTFINDMMVKAGFSTIFKNKTRYPKITLEDLQASNCELLLLSSEPFPFKQKHIDELQQHLPQTKIMLVDGEMFSWYGSRLLKAPHYFKSLQMQLTSNL